MWLRSCSPLQITVECDKVDEEKTKEVTNVILGIYGAGDLGREVLDIAADINRMSCIWDGFLFIDDSPSKKTVREWPVLPFQEVLRNYSAGELEIVTAVGEPEARKALRKKIREAGYHMGRCVHPSTRVSDTVQMEEGVVVQSGCYLACGVVLKENAYIQPNAMIGHDCIIGVDSVISPCASLAGHCVVGDGSYIGMAASVKEETTIGDQTVVGMGSVVLCDIPDCVVAFGQPARVVKKNQALRVFK